MEKYFYVIIGGSGMIGSNFCEHFNINNIKYYSIDRKDPIITPMFFRKIDLSYHCSLGYIQEVAQGIQKSNTDNKKICVINLASDKIPFHEERFPSCVNNLGVLFNSISLIKELDADVIYSSTSDVYGYSKDTGEYNIGMIGSAQDKRWSYCASKISGEHLYLGYGEESKNKVFIIRIFSCIGKFCDLDVPWHSGLPASLIYSSIKSNKMIIDCSFDLTREYIDIQDLIDAVLFVSQSKNTINQIINIGTENEVTVSELINKIKELCDKFRINKNIEVATKTKIVSDINKKKINLDFLHSLGWENKISLDDSLLNLFEYIYKHIHGDIR